MVNHSLFLMTERLLRSLVNSRREFFERLLANHLQKSGKQVYVLTDPCDTPLNTSVHGNAAPLAHLLFAYNRSKGIKPSQAVFLKCHMLLVY